MARKRRTKRPTSKGSSRSSKGGKRSRALRRLSEEFDELQFEPTATHRELISVLLLSLGAVALGAGIYAQWFWAAAESPDYAPWLLAAGVLLVVIYAFYAPRHVDAVVVGDLGVGTEQSGRVARTAWYQLEKLRLAHGALLVESVGKPIQVSLRDHPEAARRIVAEVRRRIPDRLDLADEEIAELGPPSEGAGEVHPAAPPQVTDLVCRATEKPLTIEKDVRMCARCGVFYHRKGVPRRCLECDNRLRRG